MPSGRRKRLCSCGCGERVDTLPNYTKQRRYINVTHRDQASRRRTYTAPIRVHRLAMTVDIKTQSRKLIGVSVHVGDPVLVTSEKHTGA